MNTQSEYSFLNEGLFCLASWDTRATAANELWCNIKSLPQGAPLFETFIYVLLPCIHPRHHCLPLLRNWDKLWTLNLSMSITKITTLSKLSKWEASKLQRMFKLYHMPHWYSKLIQQTSPSKIKSPPHIDHLTSKTWRNTNSCPSQGSEIKSYQHVEGSHFLYHGRNRLIEESKDMLDWSWLTIDTNSLTYHIWLKVGNGNDHWPDIFL